MSERFTDGAWESPESKLSAAEFCRVCLIDVNKSGEKKTKAKCFLPVRSRPGAPYNKNAIRAAMGGHGILRVKGVPAEVKRKAARRLVRLARAAGIEVTSQALLRLAGQK